MSINRWTNCDQYIQWNIIQARNEAPIHATTNVSERTAIKGHILYDPISMKYPEQVKSIETKSRLVAVRGCGGGETQNSGLMSTEFSFVVMETFWN